MKVAGCFERELLYVDLVHLIEFVRKAMSEYSPKDLETNQIWLESTPSASKTRRRLVDVTMACSCRVIASKFEQV